MNYISQAEKKVYTVDEIHKMLGMGINQTYKFIKESPPFPVKKIRNKFCIPKEPFDHWLISDE